MKIGTFSVVCGTEACNATCPFCVAKMTPDHSLVPPKETNWRNLDIACRFAKEAGATTALITGKGEPTLYPDLVSSYIRHLSPHFPFVEMQTNGIVLCPGKGKEETLKLWYENGLTMVSLSIVHHDPIKNAVYMSPKHPYNVWGAVNLLHKIGFSVRINCTMFEGGVDSWDSIHALISMCQSMGVEQITLRDVTKPDNCENVVALWVKGHQPKKPVSQIAVENLEALGATKLLQLGHGATVYDFHGQNVCVNNCLTENTNPEEIRQLIFFPNGGLFYSWNFQGARIL